jgi:hypothetical protein
MDEREMRCGAVRYGSTDGCDVQDVDVNQEGLGQSCV